MTPRRSHLTTADANELRRLIIRAQDARDRLADAPVALKDTRRAEWEAARDARDVFVGRLAAGDC